MKLIWMRGGYQSSVRDLGMLLLACKVKAEMFLFFFFFFFFFWLNEFGKKFKLN